jgi:hypothetical protein
MTGSALVAITALANPNAKIDNWHYHFRRPHSRDIDAEEPNRRLPAPS